VTPNLTAYERCVKGMLDDPECVGELLLVGLMFARAQHLGDPAPIGPDLSLKALARPIYGNGAGFNSRDLVMAGDDEYASRRYPARGWRRIVSVITADARRYQPPGYTRRAMPCGRPGIRGRDKCGRDVVDSTIRPVTDPLTGERDWIGSCSNTGCKAWLAAVLAKNKAEQTEHPPPRPAANTGGVLERHLPDIDWWRLWTALDPNWSPPPEAEPFRSPKLTVVANLDDTDDDQEPSTAPARPVLIVLEGGWTA
jgi:hypothetical protein